MLTSKGSNVKLTFTFFIIFYYFIGFTHIVFLFLFEGQPYTRLVPE